MPAAVEIGLRLVAVFAVAQTAHQFEIGVQYQGILQLDIQPGILLVCVGLGINGLDALRGLAAIDRINQVVDIVVVDINALFYGFQR